MKDEKQSWINDTALFYFQIFSRNYGEKFLKKLLKGGGGNSTLCASWYQLSPVFVSQRVSDTALKLLIEKSISITKDPDKRTVVIKKSEIDKHRGMFYNNAKGADNRKSAGKFFHFDHNPSNKKILSLLNDQIREFLDSKITEDAILEQLGNYLESIQSVDLITVEQDQIRTSADLQDAPLTKEERDKILHDEWWTLNIDSRRKKSDGK